MSERHGSIDYALDAVRSRIGFTARHALISKVKGHFAEFEGSAVLNFEDPDASSTEITIQTASIDTRNGPRDEQLRANEFLDAPTYPTIAFTSTRVVQVDDRRFDVTGDLTIKATTREVTVTFELQHDTQALHSMRFKGTSSINRRDWKVEWPPPLETGGVLIGDKVAIEIDVTVIQEETS